MIDLLKINVSDHIEKKNGLSYLSWAFAWQEVLKIDPTARWHVTEYSNEHGSAVPCMYLNDGTAFVKVEVTIKGDTKQSILPVMNHRNQAIQNPNAFDVNKNIMRCLAKAIAMHGLGLYIYNGEDLPEFEQKEPDVPMILKSIANSVNIETLKNNFTSAMQMLDSSHHAEVISTKDKRKAELTTKEKAA